MLHVLDDEEKLDDESSRASYTYDGPAELGGETSEIFFGQIKYEIQDGKLQPFGDTQPINTLVKDYQLLRHSWTSAMVRALIEEYGTLASEFRNPLRKQRDLWILLAENMSMHGYELTGEMCDKKWRNLKQTFRSIYNDSARKIISKRRWEFYDDLDKLLDISEKEQLKKTKYDQDGTNKFTKIESITNESDLNGVCFTAHEEGTISDTKVALTGLLHSSDLNNLVTHSLLLPNNISKIDNPLNIGLFDFAQSNITEDVIEDVSDSQSTSNSCPPDRFQEFLELYQRNEDKRLECLQQMHMESLIIEKKKNCIIRETCKQNELMI